MIYTHLTKLAMTIAYQAHHGQTDHGGMPYIFHPYHLAEQMCDEYTTCAALLHDVVEDTDMTIEELAKVFPKALPPIVRAATRPDTTREIKTFSVDRSFIRFATIIADVLPDTIPEISPTTSLQILATFSAFFIRRSASAAPLSLWDAIE